MHRSNVKEGSTATEVHGKFRSLSDIKAVNRTRRIGECDLESTSEDRFCLLSLIQSQERLQTKKILSTIDLKKTRNLDSSCLAHI